MSPDQLQKKLADLGWTLSAVMVNGDTGLPWHAYQRLDGAVDCSSNHRPPALILVPYRLEHNGEVQYSVEFEVTGEIDGGVWLKLKAYSVSMDEAIDAIPNVRSLLMASWNAAANPSTPSSHWRKNGEPDPHAGHYDQERAALTLGKFTDDELANAAFMNYDVRPALQDIVDGKAYSPIVYMTAVKDRIRWLSRALDRALSELV